MQHTTENPHRTDALQLWTENPAEVRRHASVSTNHAHYCRACFCCACVDVVRANEPSAVKRMRRPEHV